MDQRATRGRVRRDNRRHLGHSAGPRLLGYIGAEQADLSNLEPDGHEVESQDEHLRTSAALAKHLCRIKLRWASHVLRGRSTGSANFLLRGNDTEALG